MPDVDPDNSMDRLAVWQFLGRVARRRRVAQAAVATFPMLTVAVIALAGAMLIDAKFPMGTAPRDAIGLICTGVLAWTFARLLHALLPARAADRRHRLSGAARLTEQRLGMQDSRLINAVQLTGSSCPTEHAAIIRLQLRALESIAGVRAHQVIHWRSVGIAGAALIGAIALSAVGALTFPRVVRLVGPRFVAPLDDHPPFTWTDFAFSIEPAEVTIGEDVHVRVDTRGLLPQSLRLNISNGFGNALGTLEMTKRADGTLEGVQTFDAELRSLREPVFLVATGETGRSRRIHIVPVPRPRLLAASVHAVTDSPGATSPATRLAIGAGPDGNRFAIAAGAIVEVRLECSIPPARLEASGADALDLAVDGLAAIARLRVEAGPAQTLSLRAVSAEGLTSRESVTLTIETFDADRLEEAANEQSGTPLLTIDGSTSATGAATPASAPSGSGSSTKFAQNDAGGSGFNPRSSPTDRAAAQPAPEPGASGIAGLGEKGRGGASADGSVPRLGEAVEADQEGAALRAGDSGPSSVTRAGTGALARGEPSGGGINRIPEAYRELVGRYFSIIADRERESRNRREHDGANAQ